jgi:L-glyceraldehyde 3-phosphate reductase
LTNKYLNGIPDDSRVRRGLYLSEDMVTEDTVARARGLNQIAARRGQTLAQMAIAWTLRDPRVTSAVVGASSLPQLEDSLGAVDALDFDEAELAEIDRYAAEAGVSA